jgi:branched-chain amino acid transport system substrate-binding protein
MNIRRITRFAFVLAIVALMAGLSGCDELVSILSSDEIPQLIELSGEIPIGFVLPETGPLASSGVAMQQGTELAFEEINNAQLGDARIRLITEDDRSTVEGGVEAFNKLINQDKVPAILGPATSSATKEVFPIAGENQVVAFSPTSAARGLSALSDFGFRASLTVDKLVPIGVQMTHEKLGYQRVAKIADSVDFFSQSSDAMLTESLNANGVKIVTTETFETGEIDFSPQLTRIKNSNPDAVFISALPPETTKILMQRSELGIPADIPFIVTVTLASDQIQRLGDAAEGAITFTSWVSTADTPGNQAFVQNYRMRYGVEPNTFAAQSYASVYILATAIKRADSMDSNAIRDAMANIMNFDTVLGRFSFDSVGDATYDPIVLVVVNGQFEVFK